MSLEDKFYHLLKYYDQCPDIFKKSLGCAYRQMPKYLTIGKQYAYFKDLLAKTESYSPKQIYDLQNDEFLKSIAVAKKTVFYPKYYADYGIDINFIKSLDDICRLPYIDKAILQNNLEQMVNPEKQHLKLYLTSGGSTGIPVGFYLEKGVSRAKEMAFMENQWQRVGYQPGDRCAVMRGLVVSSNANGQIAKTDYFRNWLILSSYHITQENLPDYIRELNKSKPKFIQGYPSALSLFARYAADCPVKLDFKPHAIFAGSENLYDYQIKQIETIFNSKIYSWYGHSERVILGGYCEESRLLHLFPQYGFAELIDADGKNINSGTGEIVGTSFHNEVMPLIRYKTADKATLYTNKCSCGRNYFLLDKIDGRLQEMILTSTGRQISMTAINMHSDIFDNICQFQFQQKQIGVVIFNYIEKQTIDVKKLELIKKELQIKFGDDIELVMHKVAEIPLTKNGKYRFLIQELKF